MLTPLVGMRLLVSVQAGRPPALGSRGFNGPGATSSHSGLRALPSSSMSHGVLGFAAILEGGTGAYFVCSSRL